MAAITETYNETVDTVRDAQRVAAESEDEAPDPEYRLVGPRPDAIGWKDRKISLADEYDAETWFLFDTGGRDPIAVLVVPMSDRTEVVRFYIGAC